MIGGLLARPADGAEPNSFPPFEKLEAHAGLPDAFIMFDGTPVKTKQQWLDERRPELKQLFQRYEYGFMPPPPGIDARVTQRDEHALGGKATLEEIEIAFKNLADRPHAPKIHLAIFLPNQAHGSAPVFLALNEYGNQTIAPEEKITISATATGKPTDLARGSQTDFWCLEQLLDRGYAFATYCQNDIDPDKNDFTDGIHPSYPEYMKSKETHWGTIAAWSWGLQRCVDYLVTDRAINAKQIAVIGHSRRGKTALLTGAFDERIALVVPHQSGTGGVALSRSHAQETVERITRVFPHWFNKTFPQFADHEDKLPIDQHLLVALVAPRALLDTEGQQDLWANFPTSLESIRAADKVWKLLGAPGIVGDGLCTDPDKLRDPAAVGNLVQFRRDEKHTLNRGFWTAILNFADGQFGRK
jgi:hypothetical protein